MSSTAKLKAMKGRYLMFKVADAYLPLSTSCDFDESVSMIDTETKDDSIYQSLDPDSKQWTANFECQLDEDCATLSTLHSLYLSDTAATVMFCKPGNASDDEIPEGGWSSPAKLTHTFSGQAYLTDLKVSAPVSGKATVSGTFTGTGKITDTTVANTDEGI